MGSSLVVHDFAMLWPKNQPDTQNKYFTILAQRFLDQKFIYIADIDTVLAVVFNITVLHSAQGEIDTHSLLRPKV